MNVTELRNHIPSPWTLDEVRAFGDDGIVVTVKEATVEKVGGENGEDKPVLKFKETAKPVVINRTRAQSLADLFGAQSDLAGKKVKLTVKRVAVNGKSGDQIVIDAP